MITDPLKIEDLTITVRFTRSADGDILMDISSDKLVSNGVMVTLLYSVAQSAEDSVKADIMAMMVIDKAKLN
ncbi:MAG: hypothetical protein EBR82_46030 [Caulobacteraceae bacterium]|nr:hypothetical protein [Caulobacteraceae bacterium]